LGELACQVPLLSADRLALRISARCGAGVYRHDKQVLSLTPNRGLAKILEDFKITWAVRKMQTFTRCTLGAMLYRVDEILDER
jgi:hypothetical protein